MLQHESPTASGEKSALQPRWHILLDYDYEMRSNAVKKSRKEGITSGVALMRATKDAELKELHFTSPITFASMQRPAKVGRWEAPTTASSGAWSSTGKGPGNKGKGKGKKGKPPKAFQTTCNAAASTFAGSKVAGSRIQQRSIRRMAD